MEVKTRRIRLSNSEIVEIGEGRPIIGIVGLLHGDEICGRKVLDELVSSGIQPKGTVRAIYANLEAEKQGKRGVEGEGGIKGNMNRAFNGLQRNLEERTAYELSIYLADCDYVLDIHSTSYPTEPFAISTIDNADFDRLVSLTGLNKYVIMVEEMANGSSLIDEIFRKGGKGVSFESGTHKDETSVTVAREVVYNFLRNLGIIEGNGIVKTPEKFYGRKVIRVPSTTFKAYPTIRNFELLKAGTPYGRDDKREYSYDKDCYPFLFSDQLTDGNVFLVADKNKPGEKNEN